MATYGTAVNQTPSYFSSNSLPYGNVPGFNLDNAGVGTAGYAGLQTGVWGDDSTILNAFGKPGVVNAADGSGVLPKIDTRFIGDTPTNTPSGDNNTTTNNNPPAPQKSPTQIFQEQYPQSDIMEGEDPNQFMADIENIYNSMMANAAKKEGTVRGMADINKQDIQSQYGVSEQTLGTSKDQANRTLQESNISARQRQEQALDSARRLYDEMNRGYSQRFGGASSAGEGARALAGVEQQRQMGTTRQSYQDTARQIETQKLSVEENYKNQLLDLQTKRNSAVNQANNELSAALSEIDDDRTAAEVEKGYAKREALKEYRDKLFNVKQQEQAFKQNLDLMREQANIQLQSASSQLASYGQAGQNAYGQFAQNTTLNPQSGLKIGGNVTAANQLTGQISSNDELSKLLAATGQMSSAPNYMQQSRNDVPSWLQ